VNYARRQQYRRLARSANGAAGCGAALMLSFVLASLGMASLTIGALLFAVGCAVYARHWLKLAGRSRVGAVGGRGEAGASSAGEAGVAVAAWSRVARARRHRFGGDRAGHGGVRDRDQNTRDMSFATWLVCMIRRCGFGAGGDGGAATGVLPVLCVVRARCFQRWEQGVLVISLDRVVPTLKAAAVDPGWLGR
jgi:hypothetical protein